MAVLIVLACMLAGYAVAVGALALAGRRSSARALARFVPDCAVLFRRLLGDRRIARRRRAALGAAAVYLAVPFDLVPDFLPGIGMLDDAVIVALALRVVLGGAGPALVAEHWPGPPESLRAVLRLAGAG